MLETNFQNLDTIRKKERNISKVLKFCYGEEWADRIGKQNKKRLGTKKYRAERMLKGS